MEHQNYRTGHPLRLWLNISSGRLEYFMPDSCELEFPVVIYHYVERSYCGTIHQSDTAENEERYDKIIEWIFDCEHTITSIGDSDYDNLFVYIYDIKSAYRELVSAHQELVNKMVELQESNEYKDRIPKGLEALRSEIPIQVKKLCEILPDGWSWRIF